MMIGYVRVSSEDQDYSVQINQLEKLGCKKIFKDKITGVARNRPGLDELIKFAREDDTVLCTKVDRIARDTSHALDIANTLKANGVGLKLLDLGDVDINSDMGRVIYTIMSAFAELERNRIRERQREGFKRAKQEGRKMGRPILLTDQLVSRIVSLRSDGKSHNEIANTLGISRPSVSRALSRQG